MARRSNTGRHHRRKNFVAWSTRPQDTKRVAHKVLRHFTLFFPEIKYVDGAPFIAWDDLSKGITKNPRGLCENLERAFRWERLTIDRSGSRSLSSNPVREREIHQSEKVFLRLEHALRDKHTFEGLVNVMHKWYLNVFFPGLSANGAPIDYIVYNGPQDPGLLYKTPEDAKTGIYALHCGSTYSFNNDAYDGPLFVMKIGKSENMANRYTTHASSTSMLSAVGGDVDFLFGLEVDPEDLTEAETLLKAKLTELGFAMPIVNENQGRSLETFSFCEGSLPLIHEVLCQLRLVYPKQGNSEPEPELPELPEPDLPEPELPEPELPELREPEVPFGPNLPNHAVPFIPELFALNTPGWGVDEAPATPMQPEVRGPAEGPNDPGPLAVECDLTTTCPKGFPKVN